MDIIKEKQIFIFYGWHLRKALLWNAPLLRRNTMESVPVTLNNMYIIHLVNDVCFRFREVTML